MQAGDLRHKIEIQRIEKGEDEMGGTTTEYRPLKRVWAKVNGLHGKEWWEAREYGGEATVEFIIRQNACPDLTKKDRIAFRGLLYNIEQIDNVLFQDRFLKIRATASDA